MKKIPFWMLMGVLSSAPHVVRAQEEDDGDDVSEVVSDAEAVTLDTVDVTDPRSTLRMLRGKPSSADIKKALEKANVELGAITKKPSGEEAAKAQSADVKFKGVNLLLKDLERNSLAAMNSESRVQNLHREAVKKAMAPGGPLSEFFAAVEAYKRAKESGMTPPPAIPAPETLTIELDDGSPVVLKTIFSVEADGTVSMSHAFEMPEDHKGRVSQSVDEKLKTAEVRAAIEEYLNKPLKDKKVELKGADEAAVQRALSASHNTSLLGTSDGDPGALLSSFRSALEETDIKNASGAAGQNHLKAQSQVDRDQKKGVEASIKLLKNSGRINADSDDCANLTTIVGKANLAGDATPHPDRRP